MAKENIELSIYNEDNGYNCSLNYLKKNQVSKENKKKILEFDEYL